MSEPGYDRRQVAGRIAAAALLPLAALGMPISPTMAFPRKRAAPAGSFALQRVLTRELGDGAAIVVTRRWRIRFATAAPGMFVAGEQIFAEVAAPPALSPLAALEKARSTATLFPIRLDAMGQIAGSDQETNAAELLRAIDVGQGMFDRGPGRTAMADDARSFMAQLARMGAQAVSAMPRDLFFPVAARDSATRDVALPGGETGTISVATDASADVRTGLLRASERVVVTRVGGSTRSSREGWSLTPNG